MTTPDFWKQILDDWSSPLNRQTAFYGSLPQNLNRSQSQFASGLFEPTFNRFLGQLGQNLLTGQGQEPMGWTDFLNKDFNFQREMLRSPDLFSRSRYAPNSIRYFG